MSSKETTYSEFLKQLEKNNIKTVEFSNYEMDYTLVDDKKPYEITYYTGIVNDPDLITTLKSAKTSEGKAIEISASVPDNTSAWLVNILSFVIPLVLIWILFGFLMRRMGGGAMGVGKSTAKVYVEKTTGVTFKDVAGQDEAKESLQEVVDFCIIRRNTAISVQNSRRVHCLSDLLEPVRHCWQKQLPERQRFRFLPGRF